MKNKLVLSTFPDSLKLEKLKPGLVNLDNLGIPNTDKRYITTSWNQSTFKGKGNHSLEAENQPLDALFTMEFTAQRDGKISELLNIINRPTAIEAYNQDGELMNIQMVFKNSLPEKAFQLYQNQPNPFHDQTTIGFYLPDDSKIQLTLRDQTGKVLSIYKDERVGGYNTIQLENIELTNQFIFYELTTKFGSKTKKLLKIK